MNAKPTHFQMSEIDDVDLRLQEPPPAAQEGSVAGSVGGTASSRADRSSRGDSEDSGSDEVEEVGAEEQGGEQAGCVGQLTNDLHCV